MAGASHSSVGCCSLRDSARCSRSRRASPIQVVGLRIHGFENEIFADPALPLRVELPPEFRAAQPVQPGGRKGAASVP